MIHNLPRTTMTWIALVSDQMTYAIYHRLANHTAKTRTQSPIPVHIAKARPRSRMAFMVRIQSRERIHMAATLSTMLPLGTTAPDFSLPDTNGGKTVSRADFKGKPLLVMFICNHCPFVKHIRTELSRLGRDYRGRVGMVAISSNDAEKYPDDSPAKMTDEAKAAGYTFPYLYDESQAVAKAYHAACTPDFFLFDKNHRLVYRGQLDDSRPSGRGPGGDLPVTGKDLRAAMDATLAGKAVPGEQKPSIGCNIKWK